MDPQVLSLITTLLLAVLSPVLAWYGSTRYFAGKLEEQQNNTKEWRQLVEKRLDGIEGRLEQSSWGVLQNRMGRAEQDILDVRRAIEERIKTLHERIEIIGKRTHDLGSEIMKLPGYLVRKE